MNDAVPQSKTRITPSSEEIDYWIEKSLEEDIRDGDITSDVLVDSALQASARVTAKEDLVLAGLELFKRVFQKLNPDTEFVEFNHHDGNLISKGDTVIEIKGSCLTLLKGERTALNMLQQLSGIATLTNQFVQAAKPVTILDTRKTTPGLRVFEKYAVACGGATNHRFGLFDAVMVKDNHIKIAGGITPAVETLRQKWGPDQSIEVEATTLAEVEESLKAGADIILLDNMDDEMVRNSVALIDRRAKIEVSGNINLDRLSILKTTGIDFISVGALTHSARAVDLSMNITTH